MYKTHKTPIPYSHFKTLPATGESLYLFRFKSSTIFISWTQETLTQKMVLWWWGVGGGLLPASSKRVVWTGIAAIVPAKKEKGGKSCFFRRFVSPRQEFAVVSKEIWLLGAGLHMCHFTLWSVVCKIQRQRLVFLLLMITPFPDPCQWVQLFGWRPLTVIKVTQCVVFCSQEERPFQVNIIQSMLTLAWTRTSTALFKMFLYAYSIKIVSVR